ncbi:hypothetical protein CFC21_044190 [Triticum aestivum]|uniref:High chlorophyll fluorescence 153 n=3 Tax=Triticum TaxID=4564 RepID=A0A9R1S9V2_TRITD|nr:uncharacterized protein LOC119278553 [Triticum dicoccoides]XP_044351888.1 uncharacterized protein LOC123072400 [Triticum aestivum]KAF7033064.1 hypothetical protein CFC21_044190 [Triticum aestivum]VAH85019.1 unnamed protein product [Triticum turgidum subsp. durum]
MASRALAALSIQPRLGGGASALGRPAVRVRARPPRRRRPMVVRAGGPPSTNVLILAFVLPLSLFVGTLVAAARVADDLDERFLREMEINKAILEENEASSEEAADGGGEYVVNGDEAALPAAEKEQVLVTATGTGTRARNRPKREVY